MPMTDSTGLSMAVMFVPGQEFSRWRGRRTRR